MSAALILCLQEEEFLSTILCDHIYSGIWTNSTSYRWSVASMKCRPILTDDVLLYIFKYLVRKIFLIIIYKGNFVHMDARSQTTNRHLLGKFLWERPGHKLSSSFSLPCLFSSYVKLKITFSQIQIFLSVRISQSVQMKLTTFYFTEFSGYTIFMNFILCGILK